MARDTVEEVKDRLSIVDVVGSYVKLTKAGRSLKGLCPFHKEKTPSFHVSPERQSYHCFGCGEGGDIFSFVEKIEGLDFKGALYLLAEKAGVDVTYDPGAKAQASKTERLREALTKAAEFYTGRLTSESEAYAYARSRGLTAETITSWQLGVAPNEWRILLEELTTRGFAIDELLLAGLIKEADGKPGTYYDRFRNRLMFPIRDIAGRTVAFTGRALDPKDEAKYLNSPETEFYHKAELLFGMDRAKEAIRTRGFVILVEGQMDLLHAHQAGYTNTVALSGTAFTERHAALLKRFTENLMLVLDADQAGLAATAKSALIALRTGMRVKAVRLPEGKDPADFLQEDGGKEFGKRISEGKHVVEFFLGVLTEKEHDPHKLVLAAERVALPLIRAVQSPMEQEHFVSIAARVLGLSSEAVRASLAKIPKNAPAESIAVSAPIARITRSSRQMREDLLKAVWSSYPDTPLARKVESEYARIVEAPLNVNDISQSALFEAEQIFGESPSEGAADDLLNAFEEAVIREAYQQEVVNLRRAEAGGDTASLQNAERRIATLTNRLAKFSRT